MHNALYTLGPVATLIRNLRLSIQLLTVVV